MITYITDQRPGEPDILTGIENGTLEIRSLTGGLILTIAAPNTGWTHESLDSVQPEEAMFGADAYLDEHWVGSTEV